MNSIIDPILPTNTTAVGPRLRFERGKLIVEYDHQSDDGAVVWGRMVFDEVLAFEFHDAITCPADSVIGAREVRRLTESRWLTELLQRWNQAVGWHDFQQRKGGASRFAHFTVYFDDAGCIDVVAASCKSEALTALDSSSNLNRATS